MVKYIHGSEDSLDIDVCYVFDEMPCFSECKTFCDAASTENRNIITIKNGVVDKCYKGSADELNNSLLRTYPLHEQEFPLLIERSMKRDKHLKYIRSIRIILSFLSRTQYRSQIKQALKGNWIQRLETLKSLNLSQVDFEFSRKRQSKADILKVIAFQIGQCQGLIEDTELYTKKEIAARYADLTPFLYRQNDAEIHTLNIQLHSLLDELSAIPAQETACNQVLFPETGNTYDIINENII